MKAVRRTFEASKHPKGSPERARLNESSLTSEYLPSYRYAVCEDDGRPTPFNYRTKGEAEAKVAEWMSILLARTSARNGIRLRRPRPSG
jgi:hypothetical protein